MNSQGMVAMLVTLTGTGVNSFNNRAIMAGPPNNLRVIARTGSQAHALPTGVQYRTLDKPRLSEAGRIAFLATVGGTGVTGDNNLTMYVSDAAGVTLVARTGTTVPGITGARFANLSEASINVAGQIAFSASLQLFYGGVSSSNDVGIWAGTPTNLSIVARAGVAAPQFAGTRGIAAPFESFGTPTINENGVIAFSATLVDMSGAGEYYAGIWKGTPGNLVEVVQTGLPLPGGPPDAPLATVGFPILASDNSLVCIGTLTGAGVNKKNEMVVVGYFPAGLTMIARESEPLRTEPNLVMGNFSSVAINRTGRIAFTGKFRGPGVTAGNDGALFTWDRRTGTKLVAREGQALDLGEGDIRVVSDLNVRLDSSNQDGRPSSLSDTGQLVFSTTFTDGSAGVFLANVTPCMADIVSVGGLPPADGLITGDDFTAFVNAFADGSLAADVVSVGGSEPPDGRLSGDDFIVFINAFIDGCP